ncbi:MAG: superinfection immunity protein [Candidatus Marinimicrobia bacterium]|nr:superinfection immunity protein [Candidatus Neomarinimicrobiota bacterium]
MALGLISLIIIIATYLIPTIIAGIRAASHSGAIFALNLLLGWTFIGWVGALIWAMVADKKQNQPTTQAEPAKAKEVTGYHCPHCGAKVEVAGSAFCHACGGAL